MELRSGRFGSYRFGELPRSQVCSELDRKGGIKLPAPPLEIEEEGKVRNTATSVMGNGGHGSAARPFPAVTGGVFQTSDERKEALERHYNHLKANPQPELVRKDGTPITEGMLATDLLVPWLRGP